MSIRAPPRLTLTRKDIHRFRLGLKPLEYSRFRASGKDILVIRSPSRNVDLLEDLELMVEMLEIEDAEGLDEAYLVGDADFETIAPRIMDRIAQERRRMENGYIVKFGPLLKKPYSSKEFIDSRDPIRLLRLIIKVPITKGEYKPAHLEKVIAHTYVPDDISIAYLFFEDGYIRITKDDIVEGRKSIREAEENVMRMPLAIREKYDEEWLFRELAGISRTGDGSGTSTALNIFEDGGMASIDSLLSLAEEDVEPIGKMQREPDRTTGIQGIRGIDRESTASFPKYLHRESEDGDGERERAHGNEKLSKANVDSIHDGGDDMTLRDLFGTGPRGTAHPKRPGGDPEEVRELLPLVPEVRTGIKAGVEGIREVNIPRGMTRGTFDILVKKLEKGGYVLTGEGTEAGGMVARRGDGTKIIARYVDECNVTDLIKLERVVKDLAIDIGIMLSKTFSCDSKLYVIGRDLDIVNWSKFKENGLVMEPPWS